jgi:hypothetical protein
MYSYAHTDQGYAILLEGRIVISYIDRLEDAQYVVDMLNSGQEVD